MCACALRQDLSKKAPAAMMRLTTPGPGPVVEPSQVVCPHWSMVVLHQAVREVYYMASDAQKKLCGCASPSYLPVGGAKKVLFVRHGQGAHNETIANWGLIDPELTAVGEAQVADLNERLQSEMGAVELIVVSPLTRAMQTATGGLDGLTKAPYCMNPLLRERLGAPCDTGRTRTELLRCFPQIASWEGVLEMREVWWSTSTEYDLLERVEALKQWLLARPEQTIAIVGHGGLFQRILGYHLKNCGFAWTELSDA